jgi:hypothetical protein
MDLAFLVRVGQFLKQQGYLGAKHFLVLSCFSKAAKGLSRREGAAARLFSPLPRGDQNLQAHRWGLGGPLPWSWGLQKS